MKKSRIVGFESDINDAIANIERNSRVTNRNGYIKTLQLFTIDKLNVKFSEIFDLLEDYKDEMEFVRGLNNQLKGSSLSVKRRKDECVLSYNPKSLAYIMLQVVPGSNQDVVNSINEFATNSDNKLFIIKEIAITMGNEDMVVKVESAKGNDGLDAWIINTFQRFLRKVCRDSETNESLVICSKTLRVMRDI